LTSLRSSIEVEQARLDGAESSLVELEEDLEKLTGHSYDFFLTYSKNPPAANNLIWTKEHTREKFINWNKSSDVDGYKIKIRHLRKEKEEAEKNLKSSREITKQNQPWPYNWNVYFDKESLTLYLGTEKGGSKNITAFSNLPTGLKEITNLEDFEWYITERFSGNDTYKVYSYGNSPFITTS
jgi:hypothetical protein